MNLGLRFRILERDGFRCRYCGASPETGAVLQVDHVLPRAAGGTNDSTNLVTACFACNQGKRARLLTVSIGIPELPARPGARVLPWPVYQCQACHRRHARDVLSFVFTDPDGGALDGAAGISYRPNVLVLCYRCAETRTPPYYALGDDALMLRTVDHLSSKRWLSGPNGCADALERACRHVGFEPPARDAWRVVPFSREFQAVDHFVELGGSAPN